ncbi:hypothetical protein LTR94_028240, partial [Friedmanniomyces endolithicus]
MPLLLGAGVVSGLATEGAMAAGAAFVVGLAASRDLVGRRWGAMFGTALGLTLAAVAGTIAGQSPLLLLGLGCLGGAICAAIALYEEDLWWVILQGVIAFLIAGYYAGPVDQALVRGASVLVGGGVQIGLVVILALLFPKAAARLPLGPRPPEPGRKLLISHMARAAVAVGLSLVLSWSIHLQNWAWAPMTAMIVLKPGLMETQTRGVQRVAGTLLGCAFATVYAVEVQSSHPWLIAAAGVTAFAAFALQQAHFATLTGAVTATAVLLVSLGYGGVLANAEHRIVATVIGGLTALIVARIAPHRGAANGVQEDRV